MPTDGLIRKDGRIDARWWLAGEPDSEEPAHQRLIPVVKFLRNRQGARRAYDLLHASVYGNLRYAGFGVGTYSQLQSVEDERLTFNLAKNMTGAVVSRITKNRPRASIITSGEDWEMQERAKTLETYVDGQFYKTKFREKAVDAFRDACIYGTGALKIWADGDKIRVDRVPPIFLIVDDGESLTGEPRCLYERRYVDREVVVAAFAAGDDELSELIRSCKLGRDDEGGAGYDTTADQLLVTEAWHLPSGDGFGDGRHVVCVDNATLLDEPYKRDCFPYVWVRWTRPPAGFWGIGLVAELLGIQFEVNKLVRQIQQAHHLCAWPRIYMPRGSRVNKLQINNMIGAMVEFDGPQPPVQVSSPVIPAEVYGHLQFLIKSAYEMAGISQLSATGAKPPGLESGIALMTLQDVQSDRFTEVGREWEGLHSQGAEHFIAVSREAAKSNKRFAVKAVGEDALIDIDWDDAVMDVDQYELQIFPTSMLPHTPAGRIQFVEKISQMLPMEPLEAWKLIDFPDTKAALKRLNAARDIVEFNISHMLKKGEFIAPEPFDDLQYGLRRAQEEYNLARRRGAPEKRTELLQRYMVGIADLLAPPPPPMGDPNAMPMDPAMAGAPPGDPSMPPPPGPPPGPGGPPPGMPPGAAPPA